MEKHMDSLITLTTGKHDRGTRATLAFAWGCTALAMGQAVTMYLTMEGTVWATKGAAKGVTVGGFEPLEEYIEQFHDLGGELLVCAPCSEYYCAFDRSAIADTLLEGAQVSGLATVVSKIGTSTSTITF